MGESSPQEELFGALKYGLIQTNKDVSTLKEKHKDDIDDLKAENLSIKAGKNAMRKEMERKHEKAEKILHERVNKLQQELKEDRINNQNEFKTINRELGEIKTGVGAISETLREIKNEIKK